jgi:Antirepressor regulating drug resistance, predicted signal transduction N-terminal membrane component
MTGLFITIVNMSITASYVALAVVAARWLLKRAPKRYSYLLWLAVAIRLVIPFSFTSGFSLLQLVRPQNHSHAGYMEYVPQDIGLQKNPVLDVGLNSLRDIVIFPSATPMSSINPMQIILWMGSMVWLMGVAVLLLYSIMMYMRLWSRLRTATLVRDRIFETDQIRTPFVFGLLKPRIYIPTGLSKEDLTCIIEHERTHIRRGDYLIKPAAYFLLIVHWFNPMMWLSYKLMSKDMEMSCDEQVVGKMGEGMKRSYASTLLSISMNSSNWRMGGPLAFGESDVKARITNILAYRKHSSWVIIVSLLVVAVLVTGFTANPKPMQQLPLSLQSTDSGDDLIYDLDKLMDNKTLYVGNASKVGGLIGGLPKPPGLEGKGMELQTTAEPYGVTINYTAIDANKLTSLDVFYRNSILLLSLIDNVDHITYRVDPNISTKERGALEITISRAEADQMLGEDVRHFAADERSVRELIDRIEFLYDGQS